MIDQRIAIALYLGYRRIAVPLVLAHRVVTVPGQQKAQALPLETRTSTLPEIRLICPTRPGGDQSEGKGALASTAGTASVWVISCAIAGTSPATIAMEQMQISNRMGLTPPSVPCRNFSR